MIYDIGFAAPGPAGPAFHPFQPYRLAPPVGTFNARGICSSTPSCQMINGSNGDVTTIGTAVISLTTVNYVAGAHGNIDNDTAFDIWTIDENKDYNQTSDDIAQ